MNTQNMWWTGKTYDLLDPALPAIFHDVQLGIGTRFIDDPTAASVKQAGVYRTNGHCVPGKITADFAKALCRAEMIENGRKVGAYSCNKDGRTMAEWVDNNIYKECETDHLGNTLCLIYDRSTGQMYASTGFNGKTATDISMDPVTAYEAITGVSKADATETECMTELFRKQMKLCSEACGQGFRYVESPLVRAIRNGWVCELQEPSLITRPSVMPGLNGLLDETGCVVLPTGEMLHRHPDCIIISTLNVDLEGCRPLNQSFIDRHHLIVDMKCPNDAVIIKRIKGMTGCGNDVPLQTMVDCVHQIAKKCQTCGATDGNVNSMRSLANWVQAGMLIGDYAKAAEWTVVSGATSDPQTREELMGVVANYSFA